MLLKEPSRLHLLPFVNYSHMVAARNIKPGEIILTERPLTFGPLDSSRPICLGCYNPVTDKSPKCPRCGFPMCSAECCDAKEHSDFECKYFVERGFKPETIKFKYDTDELTYAAVSPIRFKNFRR